MSKKPRVECKKERKKKRKSEQAMGITTKRRTAKQMEKWENRRKKNGRLKVYQQLHEILKISMLIKR